MAFFNQNHFLLALFLILTIWIPHIVSRRLTESSSLSETHEKWMAQYGKVYEDIAEKEKRFQIFKKNLELIESFNAPGDKSFNLSINQFADLETQEFKASLNGQKKPTHEIMGIEATETTSFRYESVTSIPESMDWRKRGAVTPIKHQGKCGSCWAFSTVAVTESIHQITTGELVSLSEQELLDCVRGKCEGCNGGYVEDAYKFIVKKGGIVSEEYYPYTKFNGTCKTKKEVHHVAQIKGFEKVPHNNEEALMKAVAHQPVSVYIEGGGSSFQFYSGGIFTGKCGIDTDHTVTVIGYDKASDGTKYWLVKNSWGTNWGEKGYMRIKRDIEAKEGLCGLAMAPSYPIA